MAQDIELAPEDPAHTILEPLTGVPKPVKALAWDTFQVTDQPTFEKRLAALPIPKDVKAKLWDAKYAKKPDQTTPAATSSKIDPRIKPTDANKPAKIGPEPSSLSKVGRAALPMAGTMIGAAEGAAMGAPAGPVGMAIGGIVGAGGGGLGGEALELALEGLAKRLGLDKGLNTTPTGAVNRLASAANTGMASEVAGQAGVNVIGKIAAPFKSKLEPYAQEALDTFKRGGKSAVSPAEISNSRALNFARNWSERSTFGKSGPQATRQAIAESHVLKVLDDLGPSTTAKQVGERVQGVLPESPAAGPNRRIDQLVADRLKNTATRAAQQSEVREAGTEATRQLVKELPQATPLGAGQAVRTARAAAIKNFRTQERAAWKAFEDQTGSIPIETPQLDAFVESLPAQTRGQILPDAGATAAEKIGKITGAEGETADPASLSRGDIIVKGKNVYAPVAKSGQRHSAGVRAALKTLGQDESDQATPLTVGQFQKTVSDLGRLQRGLEQSAKFDPSKYNAQLGLVKKLNQLAHEDLESVLTKVSSVEPGGEISPNSPLKLYQNASTLTRLGNEQLFNEEVRKVVRQAPEKVTQTLLRPNNSTAIKMTEGAVGSDAMQPVRRVALDRILEPDPVTKQISWSAVLRRVSLLGEDTTNALFPKGEAAGIKRIASSVVEAERIANQQAKAEIGALAEARATAKAAQQADPFATFRKVSPEKLTSILFQKDNVTAVNAIKSLVGEDGFKPVQRVAMDRILAVDPKTDKVDWDRVITRLSSVDPETLHAFFPKEHADEVLRIAKLMVKLQKPAYGIAGQMGMAMGQWGVIAGALSGTFPKATATIVLTPQIISRIFSSPVGLKWLSTGLEAPPWSPAAVRAAAQLTSFLYRESKNERAEKTPQQPQAVGQ